MKFTISVDDANKLYAFARSNNIKTGRFPYIQCRVDASSHTLSAEFAGDYSCTEFTCLVEEASDSGKCWLAPPTARFVGPGRLVEIDDAEDSTTYRKAQHDHVAYKEPDQKSSFDLDRMWRDEPKARMYMDAKLLKNALSAYDRDDRKIRIDVLGDRQGFRIAGRHGDDSGSRTLILPVVNVKGL